MVMVETLSLAPAVGAAVNALPGSFPPGDSPHHLQFSITLAQMLWFMNVNRLSVAQATVSTLIIPTVSCC